MGTPRHHQHIDQSFSLSDHLNDCLNCRGLVLGMCCISLLGALGTFAILFYAGALSL